jgi:hypothetical protein
MRRTAAFPIQRSPTLGPKTLKAARGGCFPFARTRQRPSVVQRRKPRKNLRLHTVIGRCGRTRQRTGAVHRRQELQLHQRKPSPKLLVPVTPERQRRLARLAKTPRRPDHHLLRPAQLPRQRQRMGRRERLGRRLVRSLAIHVASRGVPAPALTLRIVRRLTCTLCPREANSWQRQPHGPLHTYAHTDAEVGEYRHQTHPATFLRRPDTQRPTNN